MPVSKEAQDKLDAAHQQAASAAAFLGSLPKIDTIRVGTPAEPQQVSAQFISVQPFDGGEDTYADVLAQVSIEGDPEAVRLVIAALRTVARNKITAVPQDNNRNPGQVRARFAVSFHVEA